MNIPAFAKQATIGGLYRPAMEVQTQGEADAYLEALIGWSISYWGQTREEATKIQLSNIGYFTGYYDSDTAQRVMRLFRTAHPIFGTSTPTAEEALEAGRKLGGAK